MTTTAFLETGPDGKMLQVGSTSDFAEILGGQLLIGNVRVANDWQYITDLKIEAILNLIAYPDPTVQPKFTDRLCIFHHPVEDLPLTGMGWAEAGALFVDEQLRIGRKTYIHCSQGVSRASSMVIYYLLTRKKMTLRAAYNFVKTCRPVVCPSIGFVKGLIEIEQSIFASNSFSSNEYSIQCLNDIFPSLSLETCQEGYYKAKKQIENDPTIIEQMYQRKGSNNIDPVGYYAVEIFREQHPECFVRRAAMSLHHPFD